MIPNKSFLSKSWYVIGLLLIHCSVSFADQQNYEAILLDNGSNQCITVDPTSLITWGEVDYLAENSTKGQIFLREIENANDGFIEFNIEHKSGDDIDVGLEGKDTKAPYTFHFVNGVFEIKIPGEIITNNGGFFQGTHPNGNSENVSAAYVIGDDFRIEKCGDFVRFYKNDYLLLNHCNDGGSEPLVHHLIVYDANNTSVSLDFDDDLGACTPLPGFTDDGGVSSFVQLTENGVAIPADLTFSDQEEEKMTESAAQRQPLPAGKTVIIDAYNKDGQPVRQWKLRTDAQGQLPDQHPIWQYVQKGYDVRVYIE